MEKFLFMFGIIILAVMAVCGFFFVKPTKEDIQNILGGKPSGKPHSGGKQEAGAEKEASADMTAMEMIKTRAFWLYFAWAVLLSAGRTGADFPGQRRCS